MSRKSRPQPPKKRQESVFREAWENMTEDFERVMPDKLKGGGKKKFVLWLFVLELVVLGLAGGFLYRWLAG